MTRPGTLPLIVASSLAILASDSGADTPTVREVHVQEVGDTTYFFVRLERPADAFVPRIEQWKGSDQQRRKLAQLPQLVPQDDRTWAVYPRVQIPDYRPEVGFSAEPMRKPVTIEGFQFVGKLGRATRPAEFRLHYCRDANAPAVPMSKHDTSTTAPGWEEINLEIDFRTAKRVPVPADAADRKPQRAVTAEDLQGLWAAAQAQRLAVLEALTPEFGFYGFACEATGRKYGVRAPMLESQKVETPEHLHRKMYETTTGSGAITASLALHRVLNPDKQDKGPRTIDIRGVQGIDIAEHPWQKMMAGKTPSPEPLAKLVPHDNFYVHFKSVPKFMDLVQVLDWRSYDLARLYEFTGRDYDLQNRYEKQLCLHSGWLAHVVAANTVKSLAFAGSDGYLREGSDLTILLQVANGPSFLESATAKIAEARKEFGDALAEARTSYHDVPIESFVTPHREVSLHRAALGDFVVYSNSPVALRRVIDTHQGRHKALADSLDFQYMRTVFRLEDENEDGFAFLSDAFIRQLVGPASKIKAKRRLEALTSLHMVTHGALFTAWETEKLPADHAALLAASALKPEFIHVSDGKGVTWDAKRQVAVSDVYNTFHFPTPLIELTIDKITPAEEREYKRFREDYLQLWRQYFDPVGMRVSVNDQRVRIETYVLPLIRTEGYDFLRQIASAGTTTFHSGKISQSTLIQGTVPLGPEIKKAIEEYVFHKKGKVGDWALVRVDDSEALARLARWWIKRGFEGDDKDDWLSLGKRLENLPVTLVVQIKDPANFTKAWEEIAKYGWGGVFCTCEDRRPYRGVALGFVRLEGLASLYHAVIGDALHISFSEDALKRIVDSTLDSDIRKVASSTDKDPNRFNASVYLAPSAIVKARDALEFYLEWETHRRALANNGIWYALTRANLVTWPATNGQPYKVARQFLGFVPVSPDESRYEYSFNEGDIVNVRHGSVRHPTINNRMHHDSPVRTMLDQFRSLRADLLFKEDGINTIVTLERKHR